MIFHLFHIFGQIHPNFGQVQWLMFVQVNFQSCSNVKLPWCEFFWSNSNQFLGHIVKQDIPMLSMLKTYICTLIFMWARLQWFPTF